MQVFVYLLVVGAFVESVYAKPVTDAEAKDYLTKYGYINKYSYNKASLSNNAQSPVFRKAIERFQKMAGLPVTGILDSDTQQKMQQPRCGVSDVLQISDAEIKLPKNNVTYSVLQYTDDTTTDTVNQALEDSFAIWEAVSPLKFTRVTSDPDVTIGFVTKSHGDGAPFDGKGGVLAHAMLPYAGVKPYLHFDDDESWTYRDTNKVINENYIDMLYVTVHEAGHVLGLEHTNAENSIMNPYYRSSVDSNGNYVEPVLSDHDISSVQRLYGANGEQQSTTTVKSDPSCVDSVPLCNLFIAQCSITPIVQTLCKRTCKLCV